MTALHLNHRVRQRRSFSVSFQTIQSCRDKLHSGQQLILQSGKYMMIHKIQINNKFFSKKY